LIQRAKFSGDVYPRRQVGGYTARELLITMVVCLILSVLIVVWMQSYHSKRARAICMSNLKKIGLSSSLYSEEFPTDTAWTTVGSFALLTKMYQTDYMLWICPSDIGVHPGARTKPLESSNVSYAYGGFGLSELSQPDTPIACDRTTGDITSSTPWKGNTVTHKQTGGNVLYADGHVAFVTNMVVPMYRGKNP